jgi:hypothetical protein
VFDPDFKLFVPAPQPALLFGLQSALPQVKHKTFVYGFGFVKTKLSGIVQEVTNGVCR